MGAAPPLYYFLSQSLDAPAANLALDEALLEAAELGEAPPGILRVWEPNEYFVVLGRSSDAVREVDLVACRRDQVPVWQRPSGGGVVVAGPGCLMYAVVINLTDWPQLRAVDRAHRFVLERNAAALSRFEPTVRREGTSDLTIAGPGGRRRKFSGNSLRIKRRHLLYHGSLLYDFDLPRVARWLRAPKREPEYRVGRGHVDFLTNFPAPVEALTAALIEAWDAATPLADWPRRRTLELMQTKYAAPPPV